MTLQLRHRLILVWLGSIVLAMSVAAVMFTVLLRDFHQANAQARLLAGFEQVSQRIDELGSGVSDNGRRFAGRRGVVAALSMIARYQDPGNYQPLVFDPEKKRLARELATMLQAAGLTRGVLFAGEVAAAGYETGVAAYLSYEAGGAPRIWRAERKSGEFAVQEDGGGFLLTPAPRMTGLGDTVRLRIDAETGSLVVEGVFPVKRLQPGGEAETLGWLLLRKALDADFMADLSHRLGLSVRVIGAAGSGRIEDALPSAAALPELSRLVETNHNPAWTSNETHYAAAARLPLAGPGPAYAVLLLGLNKDVLNSEIEALQLAMLVGLVIATLLILGGGLLYLRRVLSRPLAHLLDGIEAVARGRFTPVEGADKQDELGHMARAFNKMAVRLEAQQRELWAFNAELEERVESRTGELVQARDAAEAANRAKSLFLSSMSHELRTPLNAILGFAQLLQRSENLEAEQRRDLATINASGQHLLALINDVLEISRIESGRVELEPGVFDLNGMLSALLQMFQVRAGHKGLILREHVEPDLPRYVEGDEHRLRQVLINLLGNAIKYSDRGGVTLSVSADAEGPDHAVRFDIEDTGPGIEAENLERIFEPFFQTGGGLARGEGSGLGLAISREYVALMGGRLQVSSIPGGGSRFFFSVPLPAAPDDAMPREDDDRVVAGLEPGQRNYRILVADDNEDARRLLRRILEIVGLQVREAIDGRQAVELFEQWHPHLVWMDMRMPVMDGFEATRLIKTHPAGRRAIVVAVTASAFEEDRVDVLAAGCDDFLRKPVREAEIYQMLTRHLGLRFSYVQQRQNAAPEQTGELPDRVQRLPPELCQALREAALALDPRGVDEQIGEIERHDHQLATVLRARAEEFRFEEILDLIQQPSPAQLENEGLDK